MGKLRLGLRDSRTKNTVSVLVEPTRRAIVNVAKNKLRLGNKACAAAELYAQRGADADDLTLLTGDEFLELENGSTIVIQPPDKTKAKVEAKARDELMKMRSAQSFTPATFAAGDTAAWLSVLENEGYVVLRDFLPSDVRSGLLGQFWKDFLEVCASNGHDNVLQYDRGSWLPPLATGGHAPLHMAQSDFFWNLRCDARIAAAFAAVHGLDAGPATHEQPQLIAAASRSLPKPDLDREPAKRVVAGNEPESWDDDEPSEATPQDSWDVESDSEIPAQPDAIWCETAQPEPEPEPEPEPTLEARSKLTTSLDSWSLQMRGQPTSGLLLHVDQVAGLDERSEMLSVQGAYNFFSVEEEDSGLVVVPGSHKRWPLTLAGSPHNKHKLHFGTLRPTEVEFAGAYAAARKLLIPANCLVLWNSRTLHGNAIGTRDRPDNTSDAAVAAARRDVTELAGVPEPNRLTCFVALFPTSLHSEEARAQKVALYKQGGSTSHWGATRVEPHPVNHGGVPGRLLPDGSIPLERAKLL